MKVYLDNAATTPIAPEVVDAMLPILREGFGNPSSTHAFGRNVKSQIEMARRKIASYLNITPSEIVFTSGGTEADNIALTSAILDLGVERIITSSIEHAAVVKTADRLGVRHEIEVVHVNLLDDGHVDLNHLENLLKEDKKTLVSLMHGNNEIGNLLPLEKVQSLCRSNNAYFHSDTVQTMGHYAFDLQSLDIDFVTCSAHKFHGPKGIGFLYVNKKNKINALIQGGGQERGMRGGTENVYGIIGLAKAMDIAYEDVEGHQNHISGLKSNMIACLKEMIPGVLFNGDSESKDSLYTVLSVSFPKTDKAEMLLFLLDLAGIACSGGSACSSGSQIGSHVLTGIGASSERPSVRFSFSRYTTQKEIDYCLRQVATLFQAEVTC